MQDHQAKGGAYFTNENVVPAGLVGLGTGLATHSPGWGLLAAAATPAVMNTLEGRPALQSKGRSIFGGNRKCGMGGETHKSVEGGDWPLVATLEVVDPYSNSVITRTRTYLWVDAILTAFYALELDEFGVSDDEQYQLALLVRSQQIEQYELPNGYVFYVTKIEYAQSDPRAM